jgi:hypothetical protein
MLSEVFQLGRAALRRIPFKWLSREVGIFDHQRQRPGVMGDLLQRDTGKAGTFWACWWLHEYEFAKTPRTVCEKN